MKKSHLLLFFISFFLLVVEGAQVAQAATYEVTSFEDLPDEQTACPAEGSAACTLRRAVMESNLHNSESNTIQLSAGTYRLTRGIWIHSGEAINEVTGERYEDSFNRAVDNYDEDNNFFGDLDVSGGLSAETSTVIRGAGAGQTVIDASSFVSRYGEDGHSYRSRIFHIRSGNVVIRDVALRGGYILRHFEPSLLYSRGYGAAADGGSILINPTASLNLERVIVEGNSLYNGCGAGIANYGTLVGRKVFFRFNRILSEYVSKDFESAFMASFSYNNSGGGLCNIGNRASATLRDVTFIGNHARLYGGAVYNAGGAGLTMSNATLTLNVVTGGQRGRIPLVGTSVYTPVGWGGALFSDPTSSSILRHVTMALNTASEAGGGIADHGGDIPSGSPRILISNSVLSENTHGFTGRVGGGAISVPANCFVSPDISISGGYNFSNDRTCSGNTIPSDRNSDSGGLAYMTCDYELSEADVPDWTMPVIQLMPLHQQAPDELRPNPARNAIPSTSCSEPRSDQRNYDRSLRMTCDAGAYQTTPAETERNEDCRLTSLVPPENFERDGAMGGSGGGAVGSGGGSGGISGSGGGGTGGSGGAEDMGDLGAGAGAGDGIGGILGSGGSGGRSVDSGEGPPPEDGNNNDGDGGCNLIGKK